MNLIVIGISHKTAPVKVRERFSLTRKHTDECLGKLKESALVAGSVVLSTCNRTEIHIELAADKRSPDISPVKELVFGIYKASKTDQKRYFYVREGIDAIRHLFQVAAGLDSQVLGETQILGQVKTAFNLAQERQAGSDFLCRVFEKALDVGRIVRAETKISQGNVSVGSVAMAMLEEKFADLKKRRVLIIGAGKIGALIGKYLRERHMAGIFVASRTFARALELAGSCGGRAVDFGALHQELSGVDIAISSTSSPHVILKKAAVARIMRPRTKPLFIMDLAVPRDVDPGVKGIKNVSLRDLDDLKTVVDQNQKKRQAQALIAEKIIERELSSFLFRQNARGQKPAGNIRAAVLV